MNALTLFKNIMLPHLWLTYHVGAAVVGGVLGIGAAAVGKPDAAQPSVSGFAALPQDIQDRLRGLMDQSQTQFDEGSFFPGQTYADFDPNQLAGLQSQLGGANAQQQLLGQINPAFGNALNAGSIFQDPSVQAGLGTIESRANQNFLENILPGLRRDAGVAGQEFGTRGELAAGVAGSRLGRDIGDAQSTFLAQQLASARGLQGTALGNAPNIANAQLLPGASQFNVGSQFQNQNQLGINEAMQRFDFPNQNLDSLLARIQGLSGTGGGAGIGGTAAVPGVSPLSGALGGALLGQQLFPSFTPPPATGGYGSSPFNNPMPAYSLPGSGFSFGLR